MIKITSFSLEEAFGKPFVYFVSPEYRELVIDRHKKKIAEERVPDKYEVEILSKDGRKILVEVNASIIEYEGRTAVSAIVRDISERSQRDHLHDLRFEDAGGEESSAHLD